MTSRFAITVRACASVTLLFLPSMMMAADDAPQELPELIRLQSSEIQQAWRDVERAINDNKTLAAPLPDPYFARAEIWMRVNNYAAAAQDYVSAIELTPASDAAAARYAAYVTRLNRALSGFQAVPQPPVKGDASEHYTRGLQDFWKERWKQALWHFDNAVQLRPDAPVYWYFRAVAHKQLGQDDKAQHDALVAAHIEWRDGQRDRLGWAFVRLQGPMRKWIEQFRLGDPSQRILQRPPVAAR